MKAIIKHAEGYQLVDATRIDLQATLNGSPVAIVYNDEDVVGIANLDSVEYVVMTKEKEKTK